jgi:DNA-binding transcriptional ArsR family regulator
MVVETSSNTDVDRIFHALADATRRDIVARVIRQAQSVSELAQAYAMSFAAVQKHVAVLERASLVTKRRLGKQQIVHPELSAVHRVAQLLDEYEALWRQRADQIGDILAENRKGSQS